MRGSPFALNCGDGVRIIGCMSRTWLPVLACACVLGIAGAWWWASGTDGQDEAAPASTAMQARLEGAPTPAGVAAAAKAPRPFQPRTDFETAPDLFVYAQRVSALARAGDADAQWMLSRVYDYCSGFAGNPAIFHRSKIKKF